MTNYEVNKSKILEDYYKCIGSFYNCCILFRELENIEINFENVEQQPLIKKGMEEDLLSNLGKVGEKAFKYIIGLESIKISPNQDSISFESLWKKNNAIKDFAKKHGINENDERLELLLNYHDDNNQKAHNFDYWYSVMDLILKTTSEKFETFMKYNFKSDMLFEYCEKTNNFYQVHNTDYTYTEHISLPFKAAIFPQITEMGFENVPNLNQEQLTILLTANKESIRKNGDIFTRLRYSSNNKEHQSFNLYEVFYLIEKIVTFIRLIHEDNDNLDFDLIKHYGKHKSLEYIEYLKLSKEEITNLFSLDLNGLELEQTIFEANYSYNSIKSLLDIGVPKEQIRSVMRAGIHARTVKFFYDRGITDFNQMRSLVDYYNDYGEYPSTYPTLRK